MLIGLPIPLKPIQLLWLNLLTDAFPALALGMEEKEPDIMEKSPRNPNEPIMDSRMKWQIAIQSFFMTVAVLGVFVFALNNTPDLKLLVLCFRYFNFQRIFELIHPVQKHTLCLR